MARTRSAPDFSRGEASSRLLPVPAGSATTTAPPFFGVEMPDPPSILPPRVERTAGLSGRAAVAVLDEAWREAGWIASSPSGSA